jgi:hypothetical protein
MITKRKPGMKNESERKRKSEKGTGSQKKQQKISEKSGSKKAAQHNFYRGDRVIAYSCGSSFFYVKIKQN